MEERGKWGAGVGAGRPGVSGSLRVLWAGASRDDGQRRLPRMPESTEDTARPKLSGLVLYSATDSVCLFPEGTWTHPQRVGVGFESGHLPKDSKGQRLPLGGQPPFTQEMPPGDAPLDIRTQLLPDRRESWAVGGSAGPALWERALPARLRELGGSLQVI